METGSEGVQPEGYDGLEKFGCVPVPARKRGVRSGDKAHFIPKGDSVSDYIANLITEEYRYYENKFNGDNSLRGIWFYKEVE